MSVLSPVVKAVQNPIGAATTLADKVTGGAVGAVLGGVQKGVEGAKGILTDAGTILNVVQPKDSQSNHNLGRQL